MPDSFYIELLVDDVPDEGTGCRASQDREGESRHEDEGSMSYHIIRIDELGERHEIIIFNEKHERVPLDREKANAYVDMLEDYYNVSTSQYVVEERQDAPSKV